MKRCTTKKGKTMANKNYTIEKLSLKDAMWYGAKEECYLVRYTTGYAPKHEFAALDAKGRYTHNPAKGYINGNGNLGTCAMLLKDISVLDKL